MDNILEKQTVSKTFGEPISTERVVGTILVKKVGEFHLNNTCCGYCLGQTDCGSILVNKLRCYLSEKVVE